MPVSPLLAKLAELSERCGALAQEIRGDTITRELKRDGSIVTAADRQVETVLREELPKLVPGTTVWGEEYGYEDEGENGLWVVDPVDGTSNFSFGSHIWGVSIALVRGKDIVLGSVNMPDLGETFVAELGGGCYKNGRQLPPIPPGAIRPEELVSYSDRFLRKHPAADLPGRMRLTGAFVVEGCYVAAQRYRGLVGLRESLYDVAACVLMTSELGADIRYTNGEPIDFSMFKSPVNIPRPWIIFPRESGFFVGE